MRSITTLLIGGVGLLAGNAWAGAPETARPVWLTDFAAAQQQARREQRPILAVLH